MIHQEEIWAAGNAYEPYVGRWSRLVASEFLKWISPPVNARWLDVGCGTGALTATVLATEAPVCVVSVDRSVAYVSFAQNSIADERAAFVAADARSIPVKSSSVDVVVSGLVLNFVPEPSAAALEMARIVRPGGTVALYVWDYAGEMQLMRHFWNAAAALDSRAAAMDEGNRFPICHPDALQSLFHTAGFQHIECRALDVPTRFRNFADYWQPFLGGQGPAPAYAMSLSEDDRARLREKLRAQLPTSHDGSIELVARAWAVRGTRAR